MKVVICEDNLHERKLIKKLLLDAGDFEVIELEDASRLERVLASYPVDIVFLDINMPGINGIEAAKSIRDLNTRCYIVFITAYEQFALEAFTVYAFDYIVKPINQARFYDTLKRITKAHANEAFDKRIDIKNRKTLCRVKQGDIVLVEKQFYKCLIYTKSFTYETTSPISKIEEKLDKDIFVRTHSGYIVNKYEIVKVVPNDNLSYTVHLAGIDAVGFVSRSKRHLLQYPRVIL